MMEMVLGIAAGAVAGAVFVLKVVAPRTKTRVDDRILELLRLVQPHLPAPVMAKAVSLTGRNPRERADGAVDHRT